VSRDREKQDQLAQNSQSQSPDSSGAKEPSSGQQPGGSSQRGQGSSPNSSGDGAQATEQDDSAQDAQASASGPGRNNPNGPPGRRHGEKPDWAVVRLRIASPLAEVRSRMAEELARRESNEAVVPIDRDPVPARFSELVRRYYEELGKSD